MFEDELFGLDEERSKNVLEGTDVEILDVSDDVSIQEHPNASVREVEQGSGRTVALAVVEKLKDLEIPNLEIPELELMNQELAENKQNVDYDFGPDSESKNFGTVKDFVDNRLYPKPPKDAKLFLKQGETSLDKISSYNKSAEQSVGYDISTLRTFCFPNEKLAETYIASVREGKVDRGSVFSDKERENLLLNFYDGKAIYHRDFFRPVEKITKNINDDIDRTVNTIAALPYNSIPFQISDDKYVLLNVLSIPRNVKDLEDYISIHIPYMDANISSKMSESEVINIEERLVGLSDYISERTILDPREIEEIYKLRKCSREDILANALDAAGRLDVRRVDEMLMDNALLTLRVLDGVVSSLRTSLLETDDKAINLYREYRILKEEFLSFKKNDSFTPKDVEKMEKFRGTLLAKERELDSYLDKTASKLVYQSLFKYKLQELKVSKDYKSITISEVEKPARAITATNSIRKYLALFKERFLTFASWDMRDKGNIVKTLQESIKDFTKGLFSVENLINLHNFIDMNIGNEFIKTLLQKILKNRFPKLADYVDNPLQIITKEKGLAVKDNYYEVICNNINGLASISDKVINVRDDRFYVPKCIGNSKKTLLNQTYLDEIMGEIFKQTDLNRFFKDYLSNRIDSKDTKAVRMADTDSFRFFLINEKNKKLVNYVFGSSTADTLQNINSLVQDYKNELKMGITDRILEDNIRYDISKLENTLCLLNEYEPLRELVMKEYYRMKEQGLDGADADQILPEKEKEMYNQMNSALSFMNNQDLANYIMKDTLNVAKNYAKTVKALSIIAKAGFLGPAMLPLAAAYIAKNLLDYEFLNFVDHDYDLLKDTLRKVINLPTQEELDSAKELVSYNLETRITADEVTANMLANSLNQAEGEPLTHEDIDLLEWFLEHNSDDLDS